MNLNFYTRWIFVFALTSLVLACSRKSPLVKIEGQGISIKFGQPSKNKRVIFGELVPYGKVWRTGANEATEITFSQDKTFAGQPIKAGTYTLYTIPEKEKWTIILNSLTGQWGAYNYEEIKESDVLKAEVETQEVETVEKLTFSIDSQGISIAWDNTKVLIPVQ